MTDEELYQHALHRAESLYHRQGSANCSAVVTRIRIREQDGTVRYLLAEWPEPNPLPASHGPRAIEREPK